MQDFLRPNFILFQENPRYSGVIPVFVFKDCRLSTGNCRLFGEISYFARIIGVLLRYSFALLVLFHFR